MTWRTRENLFHNEKERKERERERMIEMSESRVSQALLQRNFLLEFPAAFKIFLDQKCS